MKERMPIKTTAGGKNPIKVFSDYIHEKGLKNTAQRSTIIKVFFRTEEHLSTEDLYHLVRKEDKTIGQATVYRTLKLLCEAGLAREMYFGDGSARFEPVFDNDHHDHLICDSCGKNIEVMSEEIEALQEKLAKQHGFELTSHRMYLYGLCNDCGRK